MSARNKHPITITAPARGDIEAIAGYTVGEQGEQQARTCLAPIDRTILAHAENPALGRERFGVPAAMAVPRTSSAKQRAARDRCDAMVRHACDQIMSVGVDRFSLNEVLRLSGGSKATLVKYFGDRNGLIAAAIGVEAQRALADLALETVTALPLREALQQALAGTLRFYLLPGSIALYRAVVSAAHSQGAEGFYRQGHQVIVQALASILEARKGTEVDHSIVSCDVADQLLHAIRAGAYEKALIGMADVADEAVIAARVQSTVALFLPALMVQR